MSAALVSDCPGGTGHYTTNQNTNDVNFFTGQRQRKDESSLLARLALAARVVYLGNRNDYTAYKYSYAQYCQNIAKLTAFAVRLVLTVRGTQQ
jgi:hypothetical protein